MTNNRTTNTVRNIVCGIINKIICLIIPFFIRTIMIKKMGSEYLGLNSLFTSILQVLNLTELGFSSAIVFSMYKPIANNDKKIICALMNFYKRIYRIIGVVILTVGLLITPLIPRLINGSVPKDINIYILYILYLLNTVITYFLFAYKSALLNAEQRTDIISNINSVISIILYVTQIIIMITIKNYYLFVILIGITNILNNIVISIVADKKYPELKCKGEIDKTTKEDIKKRVYGLMIQKICATTRNSLDSIFLSMFLGLNIVAIYNNYYTIMNGVISILSILTSSMIASIGNSIVTDSIQKNYKDLEKFNFIYMWISGFCTIFMLCEYQTFMKLWMGEKFLFPMTSVVLFCIYFYLLKVGDILSSYYQATGLWYEGKYRAFAETILNIILNYILGKFFGVNGIICATIISLFLINFLYGSTIIFKYYFKEISPLGYFSKHFLYFFSTLLSCVVTYYFCNFISFGNMIDLLLRAIICLIVPNVIFLIIYMKNEQFLESKRFILNFIRRKMKKYKKREN